MSEQIVFSAPETDELPVVYDRLVNQIFVGEPLDSWAPLGDIQPHHLTTLEYASEVIAGSMLIADAIALRKDPVDLDSAEFLYAKDAGKIIIGAYAARNERTPTAVEAPHLRSDQLQIVKCLHYAVERSKIPAYKVTAEGLRASEWYYDRQKVRV